MALEVLTLSSFRHHFPISGNLVPSREPNHREEAMIDFPDNEECPDCGGFIFRPGPRGGLSQNIECVGCGSRFCIARAIGNWPPPMLIIFAERIPNDTPWR